MHSTSLTFCFGLIKSVTQWDNAWMSMNLFWLIMNLFSANYGESLTFLLKVKRTAEHKSDITLTSLSTLVSMH